MSTCTLRRVKIFARLLHRYSLSPPFPCSHMQPNDNEHDITRVYHNSESRHGLWSPTAPSGELPAHILGVDYVPDLQDSVLMGGLDMSWTDMEPMRGHEHAQYVLQGLDVQIESMVGSSAPANNGALAGPSNIQGRTARNDPFVGVLDVRERTDGGFVAVSRNSAQSVVIGFIWGTSKGSEHVFPNNDRYILLIPL